MNVQSTLRKFLFVLVFASLAGCGKSELSQSPPVAVSHAMSPDTVLRVHWMGKRRLDLEASGYTLSRIWSLSESAQLQGQTFDKLATGSWRMLLGESEGAQVPAAVFRPLFDDMMLEESYWEVRVPTNSPSPQCGFAIHLGPRRAGNWETNLAVAAELFTGRVAYTDPMARGWSLQRTNPPGRFVLARVGEWTVVGIGSDDNPVFNEIKTRIVRTGSPVSAAGNNAWLETDLDLSRIDATSSILSAWPAGKPRISLKVTGDGGHVIMDGRMTFPDSLATQLASWRVPTNLIHEPLLGFTAARGVEPWLANWKMWSDLQIGPLPEQVFFWSSAGSPYRTYAAAPLRDQQVYTLVEFLLQKGNSWLATNGYVGFDRAFGGKGITWGNLVTIKHFITFVDENPSGWLYAGLLPFPDSNANRFVSNSMIQDLLRQTNLVYCDWEVTGQQLASRLAISQTGRQLARRATLSGDSASLKWLAVLVSRLGDTTTSVRSSGSSELVFHRKSTIGFTALELNFLADWLESPQFPRGSYSQLTPP